MSIKQTRDKSPHTIEANDSGTSMLKISLRFGQFSSRPHTVVVLPFFISLFLFLCNSSTLVNLMIEQITETIVD